VERAPPLHVLLPRRLVILDEFHADFTFSLRAGQQSAGRLVTNMFGGNSQTKDFDVAQVFDFTTVKAAVPFAIYFNDKVDRAMMRTMGSNSSR
jgi:hypothetical protein